VCGIVKPCSPADTTPVVSFNAIANSEGTGRVPHVRKSVRGPKTMGVAQQSFLLHHSTNLIQGLNIAESL
jgi:hypothetical protein